ncbi:hypothetical protein GGI13_001708 [Coemansia sp. RSA 455]|nr:hypothetical protein GGI14_001717 [Coemansia sp. S680]KAJ2087197.1 hypothetical protein GGI16_006498 [Coemansia sp. S142-1]KAJ2255259.1 hypothetical protein GGI13_001708 [Coemansia sp. RSA 455]
MTVKLMLESNACASTMPCVGDAEVTDDERKMARATSHALFGNLIDHKGFPETLPSDELSIPVETGSYRIFEYTMPSSQQPYKIEDDEFTLNRLNTLYSQDRAGQLQGEQTMVVAVSASVVSPSNQDSALDDKPMHENERIMMCMPGGGFISCDTPHSKWVYIRMSKAIGMRVFVPRYHVAPKHLYPRPVHDVYTAFQHLVSRGFRPQNIVMMGASAGANICMAVLQVLASEGISQSIAGCVLAEPVLDQTMSHDSWQRNQDVCVLPYVSPTHPWSMPRFYLGPIDDDNIDPIELLRRPMLSPISADVALLPPMHIQVGEDDVLYDESVAFAKRIPTAELITYAGANHYTMLRGRTQLDHYYSNVRKFIDKVTA